MSKSHEEEQKELEHMQNEVQRRQDEIQRIRTELSAEADKLLSEGVWVSASDGNLRYIGRVSKIVDKGNFVQPTDKYHVLMSMPAYIELNPVWEYLIALKPNPEVEGDFSKHPMILPIEMTGQGVPHYMYAPRFVFFEDLQGPDKEMHKGLVSNGIIVTRSTTVVQRDEPQGSVPAGPRIVSPHQHAMEAAAMKRAGFGGPGVPFRR
jgi:hypothetical protein